MGNVLVREGTMVVDTGTTLVIDAASDSIVVDVRELERVSLYVNQIVDSGTIALRIDKTVDGTNWATVATLADTDFPAGANTSKEVTLSDSNGMPLRALMLKVTCTARTGGSYTATAAGQLAK